MHKPKTDPENFQRWLTFLQNHAKYTVGDVYLKNSIKTNYLRIKMRKINLRSLISVMLLCMLVLATGCQPTAMTDGNSGNRVVAEHGEWHFIVVGDSRGTDIGINNEILTEVVAQIVSNDPEFVMFPGDLVTGNRNKDDVHRAQLTRWRSVMQPVYDAGI